jgi:hypothetical protein
MMATAFLGYQHSPKWFDISNKGSISNKGNITNSLPPLLQRWGGRINKRLFNKNRGTPQHSCGGPVKRGYCTSSSLNSPEMSERLQTIINELGINPVYVYEDLNQPSG